MQNRSKVAFKMLTKVLNGEGKCKFVLIEDTLSCPGNNLLKTLVTQLVQRVDLLHLYLYESDEERFTKDLPKNVLNKLRISDWSTDALGWLSEGDCTLDRQPTSPTRIDGKKSAIIIDSISNSILHTSTSVVCRMLNRLCRPQQSESGGLAAELVATVIHSDLHDSPSQHAVRQTADCTLTLSNVNADTVNKLNCTSVIKRSGGKVLIANETLTFLPNNDIEVTEMKRQLHVPVKSAQHQPDPAANLTFNLRLSQNEEEARKRVQLPYIPNKLRPDETMTLPDAEDIEEDPDDDLEL